MARIVELLTNLYLIIAFVAFLVTWTPYPSPYESKVSANEAFWTAIVWPAIAYEHVVSKNK